MNIEPVCSSLHRPRTAPIPGSGAAPALFSSRFDEPVFRRVAAPVITNVGDWSHVFIRYGPPSFPPSKIIPSKGCAVRRDSVRNLDSGTRSLGVHGTENIDNGDGRALSRQQMRPRKGSLEHADCSRRPHLGTQTTTHGAVRGCAHVAATHDARGCAGLESRRIFCGPGHTPLSVSVSRVQRTAIAHVADHSAQAMDHGP